MNAKEFSVNFIAGGTALSAAFAVMHPIDTLKTQLQSGQHIRPNTLFRGIFSSVLFSAPQGGLRLSTYEFTKGFLQSLSFDSKLSSASTTLPVVISALVGDICSSVVKVPREIITTKLQTSHRQVSGWSIAQDIIRKDGVAGLFRGYFSVALRDSPFMIILFTSYENLKQNFDHRYSTLYGGFSGSLAGFATTPFDVIKTKLMAEKEVVTKRVEPLKSFRVTSRVMSAKLSTLAESNSCQHHSIRQVASEIYRTNGLRGFWAGALPRSFWWFCVCSIFFPVYEGTKEKLL